MDFEEDDNIILLLLVASGIMNLSSVLSKKQIKYLYIYIYIYIYMYICKYKYIYKYIYNHNKLKKHNNGHWKSRVSGSTKKEIKNNTLEWKIAKYNKPRYIRMKNW